MSTEVIPTAAEGTGIRLASWLGRSVMALAVPFLPGWMPMAPAYRPVLVKKLGKIQAERILREARARYREAFLSMERPSSRAVQFHLYFNILPGLALYQALRACLPEPGMALELLDEVFAVALVPRAWQIRLLAGGPDPFGRLRGMFRWMTALFPPEGFQTTITEDSPERLAVDYTGCLYLNTLTRFGVPELTPHFCKLDDLMFAHLPETVRFERTMTLGRGGPRCDFQWRRG